MYVCMYVCRGSQLSRESILSPGVNCRGAKGNGAYNGLGPTPTMSDWRGGGGSCTLYIGPQGYHQGENRHDGEQKRTRKRQKEETVIRKPLNSRLRHKTKHYRPIAWSI